MLLEMPRFRTVSGLRTNVSDGSIASFRPSAATSDLHPGADIVTADRHFGFESRRGRFPYSAFAETFRAFRGIDFTTRLRWLFDLLKPRAVTGWANNLSQNFKRFFHRDQLLKQNKS
jgi:hypothetical protein